MKNWKGQLLRLLILSILALASWIVTPGCSTEQLAAYQSHVDSRSIEAYGKDSGNVAQGGVKYTVRYR